MDAVITGFQIACAAALMLGGALTFYQRRTQRRGHAVGNDFEIGYRPARRAQQKNS